MKNNNLDDRRLKLLIVLATFSAGVLLMSNIVAGKIWNFFGIPVDAGILCFPITYILGDMIVEFFGEKNANRVVFSGMALNILAVLVFYLVIFLPAYSGWEGQDAFAVVLGFTPRIILGSLVAFLLSNLLNNKIFEKMRDGKNLFSKSFIARALGSSFFAHVVDSLVFEMVAFLGVLSFNEFLLQTGFAFVAGFGIEIVVSPISNIIRNVIKKKYLR